MKSPAFQFYPDKWQTDTRRLSWEAKGVYWELCCVIWIQNQKVILDNQLVSAIPEDDQFIASEVGCDMTTWERCKAEIMHPLRPLLRRFNDGKSNWLISNGLTKQLIKQQERREKMAQNGRLGGRPKKQLLSTRSDEKQKLIFEKAEKSSLSPSPSPALHSICASATPSTATKFKKPDFSELELYASKLGLPVLEIQKFVDYYESNGWRVGRNPMKSWQAAMRNWKHNMQTFRKGNAPTNPDAVGGHF